MLHGDVESQTRQEKEREVDIKERGVDTQCQSDMVW